MNTLEHLIYSMLEDMGIDLENDNDMAEICDKYIDIINKYCDGCVKKAKNQNKI